MKKAIFLTGIILVNSARLFSQNVGIGTTTPAAKLDVKSTGSYVSQFNGVTPMYMGIFENDTYRGYWGSYSGAPEDVDFGTGSGNANGKLHLAIQAVPKLTVNASGNVGIGTTTPNYKLHINTGDLFVESSIGRIIFGFAATNQWLISAAGSGADLKWNTTTDGGTNTITRHYFSQNGNVGIGGFTGSLVPQARLHVIGSGSTSATNNLMLKNSVGDTLLRIRDDGRMGIGYNSVNYNRTLSLGGSGVNFYTGGLSGSPFGGAIFPTDTSLVIWSNNGSNNYVVLQPSWGNTGIGTFSPDAKLDVKSAINLVSKFNGIAPMYIGLYEADVYRGYLGSFSGAAEDVDLGTASGNAAGKLHLTIQAVPKLTINASGNVGIGTTTPTYKLHVNGGDLFVYSGSGHIVYGFETTNQWRMASTGGGADLKWLTTTDGGATSTSRHYFKQNGDVGIGGFSGSLVPQARLDVIGSGSTSATNNLMLKNSLGDTLLRMNDAGDMGIRYNGPTYGRTLNLGGDGMNFYTVSNAFGGAVFPTDTSLVLWSNNGAFNYVVLQPPGYGNVGIGTYSPDAKLDVSGTVMLGVNGTLITNIIKVTVNVNVASVPANSSLVQTFTVTNVATSSTVSISPAIALADGLVIAYARASAANTIEVKFTNVTGGAIDPGQMNYYITVIQ